MERGFRVKVRLRPQRHGDNTESSDKDAVSQSLEPLDDLSALNSAITAVPPNRNAVPAARGTHLPSSSAIPSLTQAAPLLSPALPKSLSQNPNRRILWQTAYEQLKHDPSDAQLIDKYETRLRAMTNSALDTEETMEHAVRANMEELKKKEWNLGRINVRNQVNRILKIVQFAKDFGSAAASLDPIHAGLPWAAVCMLLPLILSDSEQHSAVRDGLEEISAIKARYEVTMEISADLRDGPVLDDFRKAVINLYAEILKYQATAVVDFGRSSLTRIPRNMIKVNDWRDMLRKIQSLDTICEKLASVLQIRDQQDRLVSLSGQLNDQSLRIDTLIKSVKREDLKNRSILDWFSKHDFENSHHEARRRLTEYPYSSQWLLQNIQYQDWSQRQETCVFSLKGSVGTGKTSIMSAVIEDLSKVRSSTGSGPLAYFYCSSKGTTTSPADVIRSLVVQTQLSLAHSSMLSPSLCNLYERKSVRSSGPDLEESCEVLAQLSGEFDNITLVIDALDECANPMELLRGLRDTFKNVKASQGEMKMICSSQMHIETSTIFEPGGISCESFVITSNDTLADMNAYIAREVRSSNMEDRLLEGTRPDLENRLVEILKRKAQGMFQWIRLQLALFLSSRYATQVFTNAEDLALRLDLLDSQSLSGLESLRSAYDEIYQRNIPPGQPRNQVLAERTLKWVLGSIRPLEINELASAVGIDPDHKDNSSPTAGELVLRICSNLLTVDQEGIVQLAHLSVKDYLLGRAEDTYGHLEQSIQISETCLAYLNYNPVVDPGSERRHLGSSSFPNYAIRYWPYHCSQLTSQLRRTRFKHLLTQFLGAKSSQPFLAWFEVWIGTWTESASQAGWMPNGSLLSDPQTVLFLAAALGFEEVIDFFSDAELLGYSVGSKSDPSWILNQFDRPRHLSHIVHDFGSSTCLQLAAQNDRDQFIEYVLQRKPLQVLLEMQYPGRGGETPLCKAARIDNVWAAKVLVEAGAKQEWLLAVKSATSKEMLECLISADINEEERKNGIYKAICSALGRPDWDGKVVVHPKSVVPARNRRTWSLPSQDLHSQARLLLQQPWVGMSIQSSLHGKASLLFAALMCRNIEAIELLLQAGADARALCAWIGTDPRSTGEVIYSCSTLHLAAILSTWEPNMDTNRVVRLLLKHGALVGWQNSRGFTPLHLAARVDDAVVVETLINAGARADLKTTASGSLTAVQWAHKYQCNDTLSVMRQYGFD